MPAQRNISLNATRMPTMQDALKRCACKRFLSTPPKLQKNSKLQSADKPAPGRLGAPSIKTIKGPGGNEATPFQTPSPPVSSAPPEQAPWRRRHYGAGETPLADEFKGTAAPQKIYHPPGTSVFFPV